MNSYLHSKISAARRGGSIEDYLPLHNFMDSTKILCSDNRHRILHTMWGIQKVIVPIFGINLEVAGKQLNVKDICEQDHILPDYQNKFIPTLSDFVSAIDASLDHSIHIEEVINKYVHIPEVHDLLISPFYVTGMKRSLLITTNSWFIGAILPQIFPDLDLPIWQEFSIYPSHLFENMDFKLWMDNGNAYPESARKIAEKIIV